MTITWTTFAIRLLIGFFLAVGIGIERQWLKRRPVFKINILVALGSEIFVMLSIMTPGDSSPTRVAAQIVSGVGFLAGGVILRDGSSVKGINTAATIWCAAAIGALVGSGFLLPACVSTCAVIGANLLTRPLEKAFKHQQDEDPQSLYLDELFKNEQPTVNSGNELAPSTDVASLADVDRYDYQYCCAVLCCAENETKVLELINQFARIHNLTLMRMQTKNILSENKPGRLDLEINVSFASKNRWLVQSNLQEITTLLKTQAKVNSVSWRLLSPQNSRDKIDLKALALIADSNFS
ncbi:MAG: MgtC/SapB family protein [Pleurocapsa sp. CRU_1_2]|nr:MgtC/SapB family protein [Pleurocapsa sp. CRU_1_2]